jgi:hypothetical protein
MQSNKLTYALATLLGLSSATTTSDHG